MKANYLTIILFLYCFNSQAQIVDIPDINFKNYLISIGIDTNNDGEIQVAEAESVNDLVIHNGYIYSVEGIQSFINLTHLSIHATDITELDISNIINLIELDLSGNQLLEIDLTQNINLVDLSLNSNYISEIDLSQNIDLEHINLSGNELQEIDLTNNINLINLRISINSLSVLDLTQNINLNYLSCSNNQISDITFINPNLQTINLLNNPLININVTQAPNLEFLWMGLNSLTSIDLSNNEELISFANTNSNITSYDFSQNTNLTELILSNNLITSLDLTNNLSLILIDVRECYLVDLDVSLNNNLHTLICNNNNLNSLNVKNGNNENLSNLYAKFNPDLYCIEIDNVEYANNQPYWKWDKDDWAEYSEDCSLNVEDNMLSYFEIYPNPVQNILQIESQHPIENVKIYNIQGQFVKEDYSNKIDVSQLQLGLYFAQIIMKGKSVTKRFIKK